MGYLIKSRIPHPTRIHNWAQDLQMLSGRLCWLFAILRQYWCRCDRLFWDKLLRGHGLTGVTRLGTRENWVCRHVWGISYSVHLYIYIYIHTHTHAYMLHYISTYAMQVYVGLLRLGNSQVKVFCLSSMASYRIQPLQIGPIPPFL